MFRLIFTRLFPGLVFCAAVLLLVAGRAKLPPQLVYRYFQEDPARAEQLVRLAEDRKGNGGWLRSPVVSESVGGFSEPDLSIVDLGTAIVFAQIGDGQIPGTQQFFQTTLILINQTRNETSGTIEFFDNDGLPLVVTIDGVANSSFPFALGSRQTKRFQTAGTGNVKVGWAHVHSDQPIGGTATFGIRDSSGRIYTDVGVEESPVGTEFMLFADMIGASRTGIALSNPSNENVTVQVELFDRNGNSKKTAQVALPPWGHASQFLDELFSSVPGIEEFEGSAVLSSTREFYGVTLRSTSDQLTSMPMLKAPAPGATWTKIAFAHMGDGAAGDLSIKSTIVLMNNLEGRAGGTIEFYRSDGTPMEVTISGTRAAQFNFGLDPNAVSRFVTSGTGELQTGYAVVSMDEPINGTALFSIFNKGILDSEAGVGTTPLQKTLSVIADSLDRYNTGIAVAYPIPSDVAGTNSVTMTLYDRTGSWKASTVISLENFEHNAQFLHELFPDVEGIDEFDGRIDISAGQYATFLSLRQADTKLTSMPYFRKTNGFAPTSSLKFAQSLAGTVSPTANWRLIQKSGDFALETVRLESAGLGVDGSGILVGDRIGFGNFIRDDESRTYELIARAAGGGTFDLIEFGPERTAAIGDGTIAGSANGNLAMEIQFFGKQPFTYVGSEVQTEFWLVPGLLTVPANPGKVAVTTEFNSVSTSPERDRRLTRRTTEQLTFGAPSASLANLFRVSPIFLRPGVNVRLQGTRFGDNPLVVFNFQQFDTETNQNSEIAFPVIASEGAQGWTARVPRISGSVPTRGYLQLKSIQVDNGSGGGNTYECGMNFAPGFRASFDTTTGGEAANVSFSFDQAEGQLALAWFQVGFFNVTSDFGGLKAGDNIGTGSYANDTYNLTVKTVAPAEVIVDVIEEGSSDPFGELTLQRFPDAQPEENLPGLGLIFRVLEPPGGPQLITSRLKLDWSLTGVPITLPAAGSYVHVSGNILSSPNSGSSQGLPSDFSTFFQTGTE